MLVEFQKNIHLVYRYNPAKFQINTKVRKTNKQNQPGTLFLRKFLPFQIRVRFTASARKIQGLQCAMKHNS